MPQLRRTIRFSAQKYAGEAAEGGCPTRDPSACIVGQPPSAAA
jgi:hypothetical protein